MGAAEFSNVGTGKDVNEAFINCRDQAQYEHGHSGYTGTIAEKGEYVLVTREVLTEKAAEELADRLIQARDQRIDDKWGPAGAIGFKTDTREVKVTGLTGTVDEDQAVLLASVTTALRAKRGLRRGEKVVGARLAMYTTPDLNYNAWSRRPTSYSKGTATVTIQKSAKALAEQTTPDAWLFFGMASS